MRDLIILGTGVHAQEMAEIVERVNRAGPPWRLLGYITADEKAVGKELNGLRVLGTKERIADYPASFFVPDNSWRGALLAEVPRERYVSLVDPSVFVSRTAKLGVGCVFYPYCCVGLGARVGDFVFCLAGSVINHDDVIGDRCVFASGATLAGYVTVEEDCYLGQSCTVRQSLRVGRNSMVGMGAVVVRDVPPGCVMAGNPARKLKDRS